MPETRVQETAAVDIIPRDIDDPGCSDMMEAVDSCVECVNQVGLQNDFENTLPQIELPETTTETDFEALKLQLQKQANDLPDLDLLNLCGSDQQVETAASYVEVLQPRQCSVCMDAVSGMQFPVLPCCGSQQICSVCLLSLTHPIITGESQKMGRCCLCHAFLALRPLDAQSVEAKLELSAIAPVSKKSCSVCGEQKEYILDISDEHICDACFLGRRCPLQYECQTCHERQTIEYPMYRFQPSPNEVGTKEHVCVSCGNQSLWCICPDQLGMIPIADATWSDNALQVARQRILENRQSQEHQFQDCTIS